MDLQNVVLLLLGLISGTLSKNERIYGGRNADITNFPYMASIRHYFSNVLICSGTIVSRTHILTSAHCFTILPKHISQLVMYTGSTSIYRKNGPVYNIKEINNHPDFKNAMSGDRVYRYDISVVTIVGSIEYNEFQRRAELPVNAVRLGEVGIISGWGKISEKTADRNEILQSAYTNIADKEACKNSHSFQISDDQICVGGRPGLGICVGDSGSPLVINGVVVGVASFGIPCATGISDIYTNVFTCIDFIRSIVPYERV